jgi:hypothetical protein
MPRIQPLRVLVLHYDATHSRTRRVPPAPEQRSGKAHSHSVSVRGIQRAIRAVAGGVMRQGAVQDGTQGGGGAQSSISGHAPRSQDKARYRKGGDSQRNR